MPRFAAEDKKNRLDTNVAYQKGKMHFAALPRHILQSPSLALLHKPYLGMEGKYEFPCAVVENQPPARVLATQFRGGDADGAGRPAYVDAELARVSEEIFRLIEEQDKESSQSMIADVTAMGASEDAECVPYRKLDFGGKKWMMKHDGSYGLRKDRKVESERLGYFLVENYVGGEPYVVFFDGAKATRPKAINRHDMTDAILLAMWRALQRYKKRVAKALGRRRPHEVRSDYAVLTPEQMHHGTIRAFGVDPGTRSMGMCLVELVGMQAPPPGRRGLTSVDGADDPDPIFRILCVEVVDLESAWSETQGHALLSKYVLRPELAPLLRPNYERDLTLAVFDAAITKKKPQKRKRASDDTEGEAAGKRQKRDEPAAPDDDPSGGNTATTATLKKRKRASDDEVLPSRRRKRLKRDGPAAPIPFPEIAPHLFIDLVEDE